MQDLTEENLALTRYFMMSEAVKSRSKYVKSYKPWKV
jgi:hypothetical protein